MLCIYTHCILKEINIMDDDRRKITLGNYETVRAFVKNAILDLLLTCVSNSTSHELYRSGFGHKHKKKLLK